MTGVSDNDSDWSVQPDRPIRFGVLFAAVWLVFLVYPLEAGWAARGELLTGCGCSSMVEP